MTAFPVPPSICTGPSRAYNSSRIHNDSVRKIICRCVENIYNLKIP
uniref:Uncharacterized protein n=1 Tax=Meloidogyne enterolobii TaxID=390850 RepID=A0A6V7VSU2_MELEN|nr:unnamed protein product [Meloidogyne enterolobii]